MRVVVIRMREALAERSRIKAHRKRVREASPWRNSQERHGLLWLRTALLASLILILLVLISVDWDSVDILFGSEAPSAELSAAMERERDAEVTLRQFQIVFRSTTDRFDYLNYQYRRARTRRDKAQIQDAQDSTRLALDRARRDLAEASTSLAEARNNLRAIRSQAAADRRHAIKILTLSSLFGIATIVVLVGAYLSIAAGQRLKYNQRAAMYRISNADQKTHVTNGSRVEALIRANNERLEAYHSLVTTYAESSRLTAKVVIAAGFVFLLLACGAAMIGSNKTVVVAAAAISAVGAVFTGYVASVVLRNSEGSSREVQAFFNHPIQVERILAAERLSDSLQGAGEEQAKLAIINALVASGGSTGSQISAPSG
jgi:hypothetical protein